MAATYMYLTHYSEALNCCEEALKLGKDKVSLPFFRKSQVKLKNYFLFFYYKPANFVTKLN